MSSYIIAPFIYMFLCLAPFLYVLFGLVCYYAFSIKVRVSFKEDTYPFVISNGSERIRIFEYLFILVLVICWPILLIPVLFSKANARIRG